MKNGFFKYLFLVLMLSSIGASAGPLAPKAFLACKIVCVATCSIHIGPIWNLPHCLHKCFHVCKHAAFACLGNGTEIIVSEKGVAVKKNIASITGGELVRTLKHGKLAWTEVLRNIRTEGNFEFIQLQAENATGGDHKTLKVTPEHGLVLTNDLGEKTIDSAAHVRVGDRMVTANGDFLSVVAISTVTMNEKYTLETADGTILASDLFMTTLCSEEVSGGERLFERTMKDWCRRHNLADCQ